MINQMLLEPIELTDAELDAVSGGQPILPNVAVGNLVNVQVSNAGPILSNNDVAAAVSAVVLGTGAFSQANA